MLAAPIGDVVSPSPGTFRFLRGIPLPARLVTALRAHQQAYGDSRHVFTREDGVPLDRDALSWRVGKVFRDSEFPHLQDVYVMRHTFAPIMDDKGVKHQTIADWMGHKNVKKARYPRERVPGFRDPRGDRGPYWT